MNLAAVLLPGVDQRLQQCGLAGAGDADRDGEPAAGPELLHHRPLRLAVFADVKSSSGKRATAAAICAGVRAAVLSLPAARRAGNKPQLLVPVQGCRDARPCRGRSRLSRRPKSSDVCSPRCVTPRSRIALVTAFTSAGEFDAGGDQPLGGGKPRVRPLHGGATLQRLVEHRKGRPIGGLQPVLARGFAGLRIGPEDAAVLVADLGRGAPPGRGIAQIIGLRTPRVLHTLFEQADLPVGVEAVPIEALFGGIGARSGGAARWSASRNAR